MASHQTNALDGIVVWLDELGRVIKPMDYKSPRFSRVVTPMHLDVAYWCDVFEIKYPDALIRVNSPRQSITISRGGPFSASNQKRHQRTKQVGDKYWAADTPSTWTYRSICRHLRRRGMTFNITNDLEILPKQSTPNFLSSEFNRLIKDPKFAAAFTESEWAKHLEPSVHERRWPFRNPLTDPFRFFRGRLEIVGTPDMRLHESVPPSARTWLEYHWAAYCMLCIWAYYKSRTARIAADPGAWFTNEQVEIPKWDWAAKVQRDGTVLFACISPTTSLLETRHHKPKSARICEQQVLMLERSRAIQNACKGPCLTWSQKEGWNVITAVAPDGTSWKRHSLRGTFKVRPHFWLFPANGGYVARLETIPLQVTEQSPREAILNLRTAYAQYVKTFPTQALRAVGSDATNDS
jgi:hypothetical protein